MKNSRFSDMLLVVIFATAVISAVRFVSTPVVATVNKKPTEVYSGYPSVVKINGELCIDFGRDYGPLKAIDKGISATYDPDDTNTPAIVGYGSQVNAGGYWSWKTDFNSVQERDENYQRLKKELQALK